MDVNFDEENVPAYTLPDPLRFEDGRPVASADHWHERRRELLELFSVHVYGRTPAPPSAISWRVREDRSGALEGLATRTQVRIFLLGNQAGPWLDLLVYAPAARPEPVPVFVGLNFQGNHTVHSDPRIRLPDSPVRGGSMRSPKAVPASEQQRGTSASRWPIEAIVRRGYAIATAYYGDLAFDDPERAFAGVLGALGPGPGSRTGAGWGAIGAWAFGLSRVMDWIEARPGLHASGVAVVGHSRLGKAALWAGAQDERFALVVSNDSGCGGAALFRRCFGENVATINSLFPHWFAPRFREYGGREQALPVDQHQLLALVAPRLLYVASAEEDLWADPRGERLATEATHRVCDLLGTPRAGYHARAGQHDLTAVDWDHFLDFADRYRIGPGPNG
jgi:hypothetical protein